MYSCRVLYTSLQVIESRGHFAAPNYAAWGRYGFRTHPLPLHIHYSCGVVSTSVDNHFPRKIDIIAGQRSTGRILGDLRCQFWGDVTSIPLPLIIPADRGKSYYLITLPWWFKSLSIRWLAHDACRLCLALVVLYSSEIAQIIIRAVGPRGRSDQSSPRTPRRVFRTMEWKETQRIAAHRSATPTAGFQAFTRCTDITTGHTIRLMSVRQKPEEVFGDHHVHRAAVRSSSQKNVSRWCAYLQDRGSQVCDDVRQCQRRARDFQIRRFRAQQPSGHANAEQSRKSTGVVLGDEGDPTPVKQSSRPTSNRRPLALSRAILTSTKAPVHLPDENSHPAKALRQHCATTPPTPSPPPRETKVAPSKGQRVLPSSLLGNQLSQQAVLVLGSSYIYTS